MRRSRRSKKKDVRTHFEKRCLKGLGYLPNEKELIKKIQNQELEFVYRQSCRVTHWKWLDPIFNIACILPYDKERKQIITVLFEDLSEYKYIGDKENVEERRLYGDEGSSLVQ